MNDYDLDAVRELRRSGAADSVRTLLASLARVTAAIPRGDAGTVTPDCLHLHPSVTAAEAIRDALVNVLSRCARECPPGDLEACAELDDVTYAVTAYYPPAGLCESAELSLSFDKVRELAVRALGSAAPRTNS